MAVDESTGKTAGLGSQVHKVSRLFIAVKTRVLSVRHESGRSLRPTQSSERDELMIGSWTLVIICDETWHARRRRKRGAQPPQTMEMMGEPKPNTERANALSVSGGDPARLERNANSQVHPRPSLARAPSNQTPPPPTRLRPTGHLFPYTHPLQPLHHPPNYPLRPHPQPPPSLPSPSWMPNTDATLRRTLCRLLRL
ncbi:hypothetical protein IWX50DRAFT_181585 [Phyllosticta citricarpa]